MIGKIISHYKIIEKLGEGGMGVVYKAHDTKLDRTVALKFLPSHITANDNDKERFLQEAKAAAALNHPNVCVIYDIQEYDDPIKTDPADRQQFIIMEYVDGKTLRQLLTDRGQFTIENAVDYAIQIGEALQEAHNKGIIHRDVKSDNIMITAANQVKVMDFGLAKLKGSLKLTKTFSTVGTLAYMAPEQIEGREIDTRSDIFSFGIVLYEMLTGQLPFKGDYESALMYSILYEEPEPVEKHLPDISSELLHILNQSLEKDPNKRYQSMKELLIDLHRLERDTLKISKISNAYYESEKTNKVKSKFKKFIISVSALILIILLAIGYIFTIYDSEEEYERIPIAVIDFVNETNETELDGLSGMLITALEQSKRLSVLTRSRMFDILKQLKINEIERIDESLGRKICKEAKVSMLATATIRKFGKLYTIDFKVLNVDKNEYLFTSKEQAEGQESIPAMIDNLSEKVRKGLKEKVSEIKTSSVNIAEITSPNLEAYQHYFKGEEFINKMKFDLARKEFKKAIKLDSTFGLAYYRLAYAIDWELNPQNSAQYITKAISMLNRIPEKERYLVRSEHARIEKGMEAGIAILEEMKQIYPNDKEMLYNIGDWSYHVGDLIKAKQYLEKVLAMDPIFVRALQHLTWTYRELGLYEKMMGIAKSYVAVSESVESYNLLAEAYMLTGEFETGLKSLKQIQELHPDRYYLSGSIARMYILQGQYEEAEKELKILVEKDKPLEIQRLGNEYLAGFYPYVGKYRRSIQACDKVIAFYWQIKDTSLASYWQLVKGLIKVEGWNDLDAAWKEAEKTFHFQNQINYLFYWPALSLLYVFCGDFVLADNLAAKFYNTKWWYLTVRSLIQTEKQECNKSESLIDTVLHKGGGFAKILVLYSLAECQYEQGQLDKAANNLLQLQRIYDNKFSVRAWYYPKSFYLLGKIYEKKGDYDLALKNYEKFLEIWKNADEDLPELIEAKERLKNLKGTVLSQ
jgi:serine/threonine protein kinase/predicted Zn-dependent protease